ncbi:hypothetical protein [Psychromonas sp. Urea-02u-13]|uniref:hypothetical protein n=1 Tax=Psychromonas sp. Urea-02u-13 TaxID=2058326 RepID=UPI0012FE9053|nr:hypothetical protein [Psychromonas sp. Urea-02u-13]
MNRWIYQNIDVRHLTYTVQEVINGHRFPVELATVIPKDSTRGNPIKFNILV